MIGPTIRYWLMERLKSITPQIAASASQAEALQASVMIVVLRLKPRSLRSDSNDSSSDEPRRLSQAGASW